MIILATLRMAFIVLHTVFWGGPVYFLSFFDPYAERAARLIRFWAKGNLWACGVSVRVQGLSQLNPHSAYLFMSNHQSQFDILALMAALEDFPLRWVAKHELRKVPILGACMYRTHQVLVDRGSRTQAVATLRKVKELLDAHISVLFFPEGTRGENGRLLPFKPGGFMAAVEAGMPVVPITINGSRLILPPGDWKVRSGEIEIIFGAPIPIRRDGPRKAARSALLTQVEAAIAARLKTAESSPPSAEHAPSSPPSGQPERLGEQDGRETEYRATP